MPIYRYEAVNKKKSCALCKKGFEFEQGIKDSSLGKCPDCGNKIERIITPVFFTAKTTKSIISDSNLKKHGFTKLVKEEKGKYRAI